MTTDDATPTIALLKRLSSGDSAAADALYPRIHDELRRIAGQLMARERGNHTLQATALLNEAWLRISGGSEVKATDREHFVRIAARAMRRVLVDHARRRATSKRQGHRAEPLGEAATAHFESDPHELLSLNDALDQLGAVDEQVLRVVELRYFSGLTLAETGAVLGLTERKAWLAWSFARGWLARELARGDVDA